jgi:hypothetical protein
MHYLLKTMRTTKLELQNNIFLTSWIIFFPILSQYSTSQQNTWDQLVQHSQHSNKPFHILNLCKTLDQVLTSIHYKYDFSISITQNFVALSLLNTLGSSFSLLNTSVVSLQNLLSSLFLILLPISLQNQKKGKHQAQRYIFFLRPNIHLGEAQQNSRVHTHHHIQWVLENKPGNIQILNQQKIKGTKIFQTIE